LEADASIQIKDLVALEHNFETAHPYPGLKEDPQSERAEEGVVK
jgi:hypothetical protein